MKKSDIFGVLSIILGGVSLTAAGVIRGGIYLCIANSRNGWFVILGHILVLVEITLALFLPLLGLGGFALGVIGIFMKGKRWLYIFIGLLLSSGAFTAGLFFMKEYNVFLFS